MVAGMSQNGAAGSFVSFSSLPPEIWRLVGEQIHGPKTLEALTRVCRAFRDTFTPFLNARRVVQLNRCRVAELDQKPLPAGIRYTRDLEVLLLEFDRKQPQYEVGMNDDFALFIVRMLKAMPQLQSFRWLDASYDNQYGPCLMLRHPQLLPTLQKSQTLRKLSIQFASQCLEEDAEPDNAFVSLKGFSNLTSLELYGFYGDDAQLVKEISSVLKNLPTLKMLGLGMAYLCDPSGSSEVLILKYGDPNFLENLCLEYHSRRGSSPLALDTLRLGHGMFFYKSDPTSADNFLAKMVKVEELKTFHIWNGWVRFTEDEDEDALPWKLDFTLLKGCETLHQLSVTRLSSEVRKWLNGPGRSVEELMVTDHYSMYDETLYNFNLLRLPHLTMLFTREVTVQARGGESEWSDIDSSDSDTDYFSSTPYSNPISEKYLNRVMITVLDRLYDSGSQLSQLGICFDFEAHWKQFSSHLLNLQNLTQLSLHSRSHKTGQYPRKASSLWAGVENPKEIAIRYAKLARSKCPSLQYIQIGVWAWQITAPHGFVHNETEEDIFDQVELRQLEREEILAIELFAMDSFTTQSGLTGPEYPEEETTEEEEMRLNRLFERIDQAIAEGRDPRELIPGLELP